MKQRFGKAVGAACSRLVGASGNGSFHNRAQPAQGYCSSQKGELSRNTWLHKRGCGVFQGNAVSVGSCMIRFTYHLVTFHPLPTFRVWHTVYFQIVRGVPTCDGWTTSRCWLGLGRMVAPDVVEGEYPVPVVGFTAHTLCLTPKCHCRRRGVYAAYTVRYMCMMMAVSFPTWGPGDVLQDLCDWGFGYTGGAGAGGFSPSLHARHRVHHVCVQSPASTNPGCVLPTKWLAHPSLRVSPL